MTAEAVSQVRNTNAHDVAQGTIVPLEGNGALMAMAHLQADLDVLARGSAWDHDTSSKAVNIELDKRMRDKYIILSRSIYKPA